MSIAKIVTAVRRGRASFNAADAGDRTGAGSLTTLVAGAGSVAWTSFDRFIVQATGSTTQQIVRLFLDDGTNKTLIAEIPVQPRDPSSVLPAWTSGWVSGGGLKLFGTGESIKVSSEKAEAFIVTAEVSDWN